VPGHPQVEVQLQLSVNPPPLSEDRFDVCIRFGAPPDARVIARRLAPNRRLLVASPAYLARAGTPQSPQDLARHNCIGIRQGDEAYGIWRLDIGQAIRSGHRSDGQDPWPPERPMTAKSRSTGHWMAMASCCDPSGMWRGTCAVAGLSKCCLAHRAPPADIYAVVPVRHLGAARVRAFTDFIADFNSARAD
jgi:LysR family transcriptional activator of dmlA